MKESPPAIRSAAPCSFALSLWAPLLLAVGWRQLREEDHLCKKDYHLSRPDENQGVLFLCDGWLARASLVFPSIPEGCVALDVDHPYYLLPMPVRKWLARLGVALTEHGGLRCGCGLSIACVVHQFRPKAESEGMEHQHFWYRSDLYPDEAAVLFIPLS